jgi:hypothetical protein
MYMRRKHFPSLVRLNTGALWARLAVLVLCLFPVASLVSLGWVALSLAARLSTFNAQQGVAQRAIPHAPTGVLLIGALANAGGLPF